MRCNNTTLPMLLSLLILAGCLSMPTHAQPLSQLLSPCVNDQTFAVVQLDVMRLDVDALFDRTSEVSSGLVSAGQVERDKALWQKRRNIVKAQVTTLKETGVKRIYVALSLHDGVELLIAIPVAKRVNESSLKQWIDTTVKESHIRYGKQIRKGSLFIVGDQWSIKHLEQLPSVVRPELDKALKGKAIMQVALIPSADTRRILEVMLPTLSDQQLQVQGNAITKGLQWAALAVDLPPQQMLKLYVQSADTHSAQALKELLSALWTIVGKMPDLAAASPNLKTALDTLNPDVNNNSLQLTLNDKQCDHLSANLLGPGLLVIRRRVERITCATNLSGIGKAIIIHANDFDDRFPPDLETLIQTVEMTRRGLRCSGNKKPGASYV